jgi:hypothetical protein
MGLRMEGEPYVFYGSNGRIIRSRVEQVYPTIPAGSVALTISDGPYGISKAVWDRIASLPDFYRPHIAEWTRISAPSSSLYFWSTSEGWASVHPEIVAAGWTFRCLIVWVKPNAASIKSGENHTAWPDITEVCGFYQRNGVAVGGPMVAINEAAGYDERNTIRTWLNEERQRAGLRGDALEEAVNRAGGKGEMICRHSFIKSQWCMPTFAQWCALHRAWNTEGAPEGRPYLQRDRSRVYDLDSAADHEALRSEYEALRSEYEALRSEYEALRVPFFWEPGASNVWTVPQVAGTERLKDAGGDTLHPCQKPLVFAERMIRASSRPGDTVFVPFGGTCREAVAAEQIAAAKAEEARRYIVVEADEEGRDYIGAAVAEIRGGRWAAANPAQLWLFGGR